MEATTGAGEGGRGEFRSGGKWREALVYGIPTDESQQHTWNYHEHKFTATSSAVSNR